MDLRGDTGMSIPTFVTTEPFSAGRQVTLGEDEAQHIRVRRLNIGARVALLDGQGLRGTGLLVRIAKRNATVEVETISTQAAPRPVHLLLPIADKDRMLWLAEKAAELGASSWRPVQFRRSRSVAVRGEGIVFNQKVAARMVSALEQCGNAWMPVIFPDATVDRAIAAAPQGMRFILDGAGDPLAHTSLSGSAGVPGASAAADGDAGDPGSPIVVVVGPAGGVELDERQRFIDAGFRPVSIGANVLRFETAAVAALAIVRSLIGERGVSDYANTTLIDATNGVPVPDSMHNATVRTAADSTGATTGNGSDD